MKMSNRKILVVDDELSMRQYLEILLKKEGYNVATAENGLKALEKTGSEKFAVILMDYNMPEAIDGIDLLNEFRVRTPDSQVVVITAYASTEQAIKSLELGAVDYVSKPFNMAEIRDIVEKCISKYEEITKDVQTKKSKTQEKSLKHEVFIEDEIISESGVMKNILSMASRIAKVDSTVLLSGDSGSGKEVLAKFIHAKSSRADKPWYPVNCGAIAESLLESELFGHEKGSFTGAYNTKKGYFEVAGDGTLFLDEIGELSENMQVRLLRVLQEKNFSRVGGTEKIPTNVRLIAATNKNLKEQMEKGLFREDLYFRLNVFEIYIPPLSERRKDIIPLAHHFVKEFSRKNNTEYTLSPKVVEFFNKYDFPGNVRELKNMIERGTVFAKNGEIEIEIVDTDLRGKPECPGEKTIDIGKGVDLDSILADIEKNY
ncbi:MAG TPA: sigma-54-dependent Fis family transcriptional regulator, partial [bacterium]|nr:sigma-54-dependent Fis family transcriptional regulator [bacterium]